MIIKLKNLTTTSTRDSSGLYKQITTSDRIEGEIDVDILSILVEINISLIAQNLGLDESSLDIRPIGVLFDEIYEKNEIVISIIDQVKEFVKKLEFVDEFDNLDLRKETLIGFVEKFKRCKQILNDIDSQCLIDKISNFKRNNQESLVGIINDLIEYNNAPSFNIIFSMAPVVVNLMYIILMKNVKKNGNPVDIIDLAIHIVCSKIQRWLYSVNIMESMYKCMKPVYQTTTKRREIYLLYGKIRTDTFEQHLNAVEGAYAKQISPQHLAIFKSIAEQFTDVGYSELIAENILPFYHKYLLSGAFKDRSQHYSMFYIKLILMIKPVLKCFKYDISTANLVTLFDPYFKQILEPNAELQLDTNLNLFNRGVLSTGNIIKIFKNLYAKFIGGN